MNIQITEDQARQIIDRTGIVPYHTVKHYKKAMNDYRVPIYSCYLAETIGEDNEPIFELLLSLQKEKQDAID